MENATLRKSKFLDYKPVLLPDEKGFFGQYGGRFAPEILMPNLKELDAAFQSLSADTSFWDEYLAELKSFCGRPTPITYAKQLTSIIGGAQIYFKREDLNHTGAHKANNVIGQGLIAKRLGKRRVIAETGAGQHGVATAIMAARFGFDCTIYMGAVDVARQRPNVFWMEQLGAQVIAVEAGNRTLKDAINEALRDWSANIDDTHYVLGTACGPAPFPAIVAWLQSVIGKEAKQQWSVQNPPQKVFACVGGGSNALGIFQGFLDTKGCELVGVEAGGHGVNSGLHALRLIEGTGTPGIAQGYKTKFYQTENGQMRDTHSVAAGLDYVGVSPIIADLQETKRLRITLATDDEVTAALSQVVRTEGIIPALESSHAIAAGIREAALMPTSESVLINISGRGDKDIFTVASALKDPKWDDFILETARQLKKTEAPS